MGTALDAIAAADAAYHFPTYARKPVLFVEGRGMRLVDEDGRSYLDFLSGIGVVNAGHSRPEVVEAVREQVGRLTHVSNLFHVEHQAELAQRVAGLVGGGPRKVFFANSGAEANEGAIKVARRWGKTRRGEDCVRIVTARRSFHGRTLASLAATGQPAKHAPFAPMPEGFSHVPLNDLDALREEVDDTVCAVMLEVVQGEGGVYVCDEEYLRGVEALCGERGALLILDEVQSGCYRTGPAMAHHAYAVTPDIVTLAKALANGLPIGAVVASEEVADVLRPGDHGSTFGGGPVVCAAANATIRVLQDEELGVNAEKVGGYLVDRLREWVSEDESGGGYDPGRPLDRPLDRPLTEIRGRGLMIGGRLARPVAAAVVDRALEAGLVINDVGADVVRFLPPLVATREDVDEMLGILRPILFEEIAKSEGIAEEEGA